MESGKGSVMRRWTIAVATVLAAGAIWLGAGPAAAGGGCHTGVTQGEGDAVEMADACFTPSILKISLGDSVTWLNTDPFAHNVSGNQWGYFDDMVEGDSFTATFDEAGVYPYACTYHPGMTGAVVVGDGTGAGNGELVSVGSIEPIEPSGPATGTALGAEPKVAAGTSGSSPAGWIAAGGIGLVLGGLIGAGLRGRRREATGARADRVAQT